MSGKKDRIQWIDNAKGIAILTIVIMHSGFLPFSKITAPLISNWMLLIFPFIGGYLFKLKINTRNRFGISGSGLSLRAKRSGAWQSNQLMRLLRLRYQTVPDPRNDVVFSFKKTSIHQVFKKINRLIIPYIIVGLTSFLGWLYLRQNYPSNLLNHSPEIMLNNFILGKDLIFNGPLWFLPAYFFTSMMMLFFIQYFQKITIQMKMVFIIFFTIIALLLINLKIHFPYSFDIAILFLALFLSGAFFKNYQMSFPQKWESIFIVIFFITSYINGTVDLYQRQINNPVLFIFNAYLGIFLVIFLAQKIKSNFFSYLGKNSLLLLIIHWPIIQWTSYLLFKSGLINNLAIKPTITSFMLTNPNQPFIRIYIFGFLILYLSIILAITYIINKLTHFNRLLKTY